MLSPDVEGLSPGRVDVFLELHQLLPAAPPPAAAPTLYLHTGCQPGPAEEALAALLVDRRPWAGGANASAELALATGPLPATTAAADFVAGLSPRPAAVAVLAGYAGRFPGGAHFRSRYDGVGQLNSTGAQARLCAAAAALARQLYVLTTGAAAAPPALTADCALVARLTAALVPDPLSGAPGPGGAAARVGGGYAGVYMPATVRGPNRRERWLWEALGAAVARPGDPAAAPACDDTCTVCAGVPVRACACLCIVVRVWLCCECAAWPGPLSLSLSSLTPLHLPSSLKRSLASSLLCVLALPHCFFESVSPSPALVDLNLVSPARHDSQARRRHVQARV
jgi:hypothetical protein